MKTEKIDAVGLKRTLQKKAERKLARMSEAEQLEFLRRRFGRVRRAPARQKQAA